jgi:hypothetical protein
MFSCTMRKSTGAAKLSCAMARAGSSRYFAILPTLRTRTGIDISMLSADTQSRYPVQSGSLGGIWTHVSEGNFWPTCRAAPSEPNHARALRVRADEGRVLEDAVMDKNQDLFERAGKELNNTVVAQSKVG